MIDPIARARAIAREWGSTVQERGLEFACDRLVADPKDALYRALTVNAPPPLLFRWVCQLRAAPYSYDWIDNLGRRSPRSLTPGLDRLQVGQRIMTVFRLAAFERDRHITAVLRRPGPLFSDLAVTYLIVPEMEERCRLVVKLAVAYPRTPIGAAARVLLPPGDLVMMRRQLMTLRDLAERDAAEAASPKLMGMRRGEAPNPPGPGPGPPLPGPPEPTPDPGPPMPPRPEPTPPGPAPDPTPPTI